MEPAFRSFRPTASLLLVVASLVTVAGCGDSTRPPVANEAHAEAQFLANSVLDLRASDVRDVPKLIVDLPPERLPWDSSSDTLVERIRLAQGVATIGFKTPAAPRLLSYTGSQAVRPAVPADAIREGLRLVDEMGVQILRYHALIGAAMVRMEPEAARQLSELPLVDYVEPPAEYVWDVATRSAAPSMFSQTTPWGITAVGAPSAWSKTKGTGASVLIIDSGHDQGHEDLDSIPIANCGGQEGGCTDSSPFHGTTVLGVAAARDNGLGVVGVAPSIPGYDTYVWGVDLSDTTDIVDGIEAGVDWEVDAINMSFSTTQYQSSIASAVSAADNAGVVLVASVGNHCHQTTCPSNAVVYPAAYSSVIGVSGINSDESFAHPSMNGTCTDALGRKWSSNLGTHVDIAAAFDAYTTTGNDGYTVECGTSFAAPHVVGTVALVRAIKPTLGPFYVKQRLFGTATDLGSSGWDSQFGYGLVDAYAATGPHVTIEGPLEVPSGEFCEWFSDVDGGYGTLSYQWYVNASPVGTGTSYGRSSTSGFNLQLIVTDGQSFTGEDHFWVQISSDPEAECVA